MVPLEPWEKVFIKLVGRQKSYADIDEVHALVGCVTCHGGNEPADFESAHMLLRLKGYEAYSMKWGRSLHHASLDKWSANISSQFVGHTDWVKTASPTLPTFDYPELNTGEETGEAILDERIEAVITAWATLLIAGTDVMSNLSAYNIMNYWRDSDYLGMGHFNGAYQLTPKTLTTDGNLNVFDPLGTNIFIVIRDKQLRRLVLI